MKAESEKLTAEVSLWRVVVYGLLLGLVFNMLFGIFFNGIPQWITVVDGREIFHFFEHVAGIIIWTILFSILVFISEYKWHHHFNFLDRIIHYVAGINIAFIISLLLVLIPTPVLQPTLGASLYGIPFIWLVEPITQSPSGAFFVWAGYTYSLLFWISLVLLVIFLVKRKGKVIARLKALTAEKPQTN